MLPLWLIFSLITILLWGAQGLFWVLSKERMPIGQVILGHALGTAAGALLAFVLLPRLGMETVPITSGQRSLGWLFGTLAGVSGVVGVVTYLAAVHLQKGRQADIATITAFYFAITVLLTWLVRHEPLSLRQLAGIGLAGLAIWLLAGR